MHARKQNHTREFVHVIRYVRLFSSNCWKIRIFIMVKHVNSGWRIYYFEVFQKAISVMSICNVKWTARNMSLFVFRGYVYFWAPSEHNRQFPWYPLPEIDTKNDSFAVQTDICYVIFFRTFFWCLYVCMHCQWNDENKKKYGTFSSFLGHRSTAFWQNERKFFSISWN